MEVRLNLRVLRLAPLLQQLLDVHRELTDDAQHTHRAILMSQAFPPRSHDEEHVRPCQFNAHLKTLHLLLEELEHLIRPILHRLIVQRQESIAHECMTHLIAEVRDHTDIRTPLCTRHISILAIPALTEQLMQFMERPSVSPYPDTQLMLSVLESETQRLLFLAD